LTRIARHLVEAAEWESVKGKPGRQRKKKPGGGFLYRDKPGGKGEKTRPAEDADPTLFPMEPYFKGEKGKKKAPAKGKGADSVSVGGKTVSWGDLAAKRSDLYSGMDKEVTDAAGKWEDQPQAVKDAHRAYNFVLDEIKELGKKADDGDSRFKPLAKKLNKAADKVRAALKADKPAAKSKSAPKSFGKNKKVTPKASSLKKVSNILKEHKLDEESDEVGEMTGFKKTLGQRVPEAKKGQFYVRNETKLKADFIKNMSPANYDSPEAFKKAQERMKKMPASDFGKILAAITAEDDTEE
jgi:hypothetical protein